MQNYCWDGTHLHWREADNIPPAAQFISSPYDVDAHYARKYTTPWVGYKVPITETCEDDLPHLITHIETTPGPTADGAVTPQIDGDRQHATCPAGKTSISWAPVIDMRGNPVIQVRFSTRDCRRCDHIAECIRSQTRYPRR